MDVSCYDDFFNGKSKEEFERMAKTSEYLGEAYEALQKLSAAWNMKNGKRH